MKYLPTTSLEQTILDILQRIGEDMVIQPHRVDELMPRYIKMQELLTQLRD